MDLGSAFGEIADLPVVQDCKLGMWSSTHASKICRYGVSHQAVCGLASIVKLESGPPLIVSAFVSGQSFLNDGSGNLPNYLDPDEGKDANDDKKSGATPAETIDANPDEAKDGAQAGATSAEGSVGSKAVESKAVESKAGEKSAAKVRTAALNSMQWVQLEAGQMC